MAATPKEIYDNLVLLITAKVPGFQVRFKDESWSQRFLGVLLYLFNRSYMTDYTTTLYPYVYFPNRAFVEKDPGGAWKVLAHEYVHLLDTKASRFGFRWKYLSPQILAVFALGALGAFWTHWALLCLLFLIALAPFPSTGRTWAELRGYTMTLAVDDYWPRAGDVRQSEKDWIAAQFTGWAYYRMCPNDKKIRAALDAAVASLASGALLAGPGSEAYADVHQLLVDNGYAKAVTGAAHA